MAKNALRGREVTGLIPGRDKPVVLVASLLTLAFVCGGGGGGQSQFQVSGVVSNKITGTSYHS